MVPARYRVVALAVLLAMVTYLDRVCISKLAPDIMRDLDLSKIQMGYVFSAFALAYAAFEIPTAWWADRAGTRAVLTRIVIWWSSFTIATAAAANYVMLLAIRFLFGAGEAGAWPCVARTFSRWIPTRERGTVQGVFFAGAHLMGGLTPLLVVALQPYLPWRAIFVAPLDSSGRRCGTRGSATIPPSTRRSTPRSSSESSRSARPMSDTWWAWRTGRGCFAITPCWRCASCMRRTARSSTSASPGCRHICTSVTASTRPRLDSFPDCLCS
jgi:Major Facilitator Superfamily